MSTPKQRGKWRVDWYGQNGCIRQEWYYARWEADQRLTQLSRGNFGAKLFYDGVNVSTPTRKVIEAREK